MHHETLLYMVQQLPGERKKRPPALPQPLFEGAAGTGAVEVPRGEARLGAARPELPFGWDNEFPEHRVGVPPFRIDRTAVRNSEYLEFVKAGGYEEERLWDVESWAWRRRRDVRHPNFWRRGETGWLYRTLFEELPLARVGDWPVFVSWAEASAYARWRGLRLPTEAEFHRAAYATPDGGRQPFPWGEHPPSAERVNCGFRHWSPTPVGLFAAGASAWGALDLVGNGWEWTATPFAPFPGFAPLATYPGYSQDFFDGRHYVMLGASWATDDALVRRSFRNWFQPHYPYVFAKFRCVSAFAP
jgi:ergothioneine biosynthesis protein EgtB